MAAKRLTVQSINLLRFIRLKGSRSIFAINSMEIGPDRVTSNCIFLLFSNISHAMQFQT